jgi:hypothetical protein
MDGILSQEGKSQLKDTSGPSKIIWTLKLLSEMYYDPLRRIYDTVSIIKRHA